jgi:pyridoxal 5'-phosphate synthase pdxT subunit
LHETTAIMTTTSALTIGVLAIQGAFAEHLAVLAKLGVQGLAIRTPNQLDALDAIILPGGESTSISKGLKTAAMLEPLRQFAQSRPTWGTCAGAILLAKHIDGEAPHLAVMDIAVRRNAFGRQQESFTQTLPIAGIAGGPVRAVFIRAPVLHETGPAVQVLAKLADSRIVAAQQGHLLATSFHPELTPDTRIHAHFVNMVLTHKANPRLVV